MEHALNVNDMLLSAAGGIETIIIGREEHWLIVMYHRTTSSFGKRTGKVWRGIIPIEAAMAGWNVIEES